MSGWTSDVRQDLGFNSYKQNMKNKKEKEKKRKWTS